MTAQTQFGRVDVSRHARLYGYVWRATRMLFIGALVLFVPFYYLSVAISDFEVPPWALVAQPILVALVILAWAGTGSIKRGQSIPICVALAVSSIAAINTTARVLLHPDHIKRWHESFVRNDPNLAPWLQRISPDGAVAWFFSLYGAVAILLLAGAVASVLLRWLVLPGAGLSLPAILAASRRYASAGGEAASMLEQLKGGRRAGLLIATCAVGVLLLPLLLPGREAGMPMPSWSIDIALPTVVSYAIVVLSDRAYAWPIALVGALFLWRYARKLLSPDARYVLKLDQRPPLLLLRSFIDDASRVKASSLWSRLSFRRKRLEEIAAQVLSGVGPFIAVGDPANPLPELGAFRVRLPDKNWQQQVISWIGESKAILLVAGTSGWVTWELKQIVAANALDRVLLLVPPGSPADIQARWSHVAAHTGSFTTQSAMSAIPPSTVLVARFSREGNAAMVTAAKRRERDYELAIHVGLSGILSERTTA